MAEQKITDLSYLQDISMGDETLIIEMIVLFLENAPPAIENLKTLIERKDWAMVAATAHKFRPNLSYMGLDSAREMLEQLERNAKIKENLDDIGNQLTQIERVCKQSYEELNAILGKLRD